MTPAEAAERVLAVLMEIAERNEQNDETRIRAACAILDYLPVLT